MASCSRGSELASFHGSLPTIFACVSAENRVSRSRTIRHALIHAWGPPLGSIKLLRGGTAGGSCRRVSCCEPLQGEPTACARRFLADLGRDTSGAGSRSQKASDP